MSKRPPPTQGTILQSFVFPEPALAVDQGLYARLSGNARFDADGLAFGDGGRAAFDTYFNAFQADVWGEATRADSLSLEVAGDGPVSILLRRAWKSGEVEEIAQVDLTLSRTPQRIALAELGGGILYTEVLARGPARLSSAAFTTESDGADWPRLMVAITTFRREDAVAATAQRLDAFLERYPRGDDLTVIVVDNGGTAEIAETAHIRRVENANLGGAGGFARGLIEARDAGASHCLFMDDDATFHMENLARTHAFLAFAHDPATAIAGAMITNTFTHQLWENGAVFDGICHPLFNRTDLTDRAALFAMLFAASDPLPENGYGGWWFFAFPLGFTEHGPFPFFVRGDDSGFSLANPFSIRTLNGVVSFQDAFGEKETPLIHYLDLRYHLIHHLTFESLERGPLGTAWVALQLILRSVSKFHYASAEAQLIALEDVLAGPDFFAANADMQLRRGEIAAISGPELPGPMEATPVPARRGHILRELVWALTLNGHLLPFHSRFGADRVLPQNQRGPIWPIFGARSLTYVDADSGTGYTVRKDTRRGLALTARAFAGSLRLMARLRALRALYRQRYGAVTSEASWRTRLGLD